MAQDQPLPSLWLLSDARNDASLQTALRKMPTGSAFVFRHYHLAPAERRARFDECAVIAGDCGHLLILSGTGDLARSWGADAIYGAPEAIADSPGIARFATAHNAQEIAQAQQAGADALFLSPVFATRSHAGAETLGVAKFRKLAATSAIPVIALGGMNAQRARELDWPRWAAIDGLS